MKNDVRVLVCVPWHACHCRPDGVEPIACSECGVTVAIAPSGREIMRTKNAVPMCPTCAKPHIQNDQWAGMTPLQRKEVTEFLMRRKNHGARLN